ncbi:Hypothetical protein FKW44_021670, partial [Caligus rogercresseyi]
DTFPSPLLREWVPTPRRLRQRSSFPHLFVRELPVPLFVNDSLPLSSSLESLPIPRLRPSSSFLRLQHRAPRPPLREWSLPLVFMN